MKPVPFIGREEMERLTERILADYGFDPHDKLVRPVPIEEIVEFHFDLQICWERIDHLEPDGMVMAAIWPTEKMIVLNETHRDLFDSKLGTYYFTLAHELGHWVLHGNESPYMLRGSRKQAEEVQADLFAGCLLLPRPMLERAVKQWVRMGPLKLARLYSLAECFRVSISALTVRLEQLRLLAVGRDGEVKRPGLGGGRGYEQLTLNI